MNAARLSFAALAVGAVFLCACPASPEQDATDVAREFLEDLETGDFDDVWENGASTYRNLWESVHDEAWMAPEKRKHWGETLADVEEYRDGLGQLSAKELHRAFRETVGGGDIPDRYPGHSEDATAEVEGDRAEVRFSECGMRVFLRREEGSFRVETWGAGPDGDALHFPGPYGRGLVWFGCWEIVRKDLAPEGFPLIRLPGDRPIEEGNDMELIVAEDGTVTYMCQDLAPEALRETLFTGAERSRDLEHVAQPSGIELNIMVHREAHWSHAEVVLLDALDGNVRMYRGAFLTEIGTPPGSSAWTGVPYRLESRPVPRTRDWPDPDVVVSIGPDAKDAHLRSLLPALRKLPVERFGNGVRARISPDVGAETALRALCLITAVEERIVIDRIAEVTARAVRLDGETVPGSVGPLPKIEEVRLHLHYDLYRKRK